MREVGGLAAERAVVDEIGTVAVGSFESRRQTVAGTGISSSENTVSVEDVGRG